MHVGDRQPATSGHPAALARTHRRSALRWARQRGPVRRPPGRRLAHPARARPPGAISGGDWMFPVAQAHWPDRFGNRWPPPPFLDGLPWQGHAWISDDGAQHALLTLEVGAPLHIRLHRALRVDPITATVTIRQRMERTAASDIPMTLWNISQVPDAQRVLMPVDDDSDLPGRLCRARFRPAATQLLTRADRRRAGAGCEERHRTQTGQRLAARLDCGPARPRSHHRTRHHHPARRGFSGRRLPGGGLCQQRTRLHRNRNFERRARAATGRGAGKHAHPFLPSGGSHPRSHRAGPAGARTTGRGAAALAIPDPHVRPVI
jgi:hypothetical protein